MMVESSLLRAAVTMGYSTSTVENTFSAQKRVYTDGRRNLTPYKQKEPLTLSF